MRKWCPFYNQNKTEISNILSYHLYLVKEKNRSYNLFMYITMILAISKR